MASEFRKLSFQYVRHEHPETLLAFLVRRFQYHAPDEWTARIRSGAVTVNGRQVAPQHVLLTRERIVYVPPPLPEPPVDAEFAVLYEDASLLAVSKSGNIPTSPSGKYWHNCLRHVLQRQLGLPELHAVHRLDRETSGVNLFAKTRQAAAALGRAFAAGTVEKRYAAILRGALPCREILVNAPLQDAGGEVHIKQAVHPQGRPSLTRFLLRARLPGASLVDVLPETGRTHQIRAHAAFLGLPVWGDRLYGVPTAEFLAWVQDPNRDWSSRHLLHAKSLVFLHPDKGNTVVVKCSEGGLVKEWLERVV
jgi:23S rRNA pseudouridine1911/1915/1917 synthase